MGKLVTINNFKNFVGLCLLTGSLAFGLWGCSDSASKQTFSCFEYGADETEITGYKEKDRDGNACSLEVVIPDGVTHIAEDAFKDKGLTSVTFPDSVEEIGTNAFTGNTFSSHVYIPNESATVDNAAFDATVTWAKEGTDDCFEISNNALSAYYCGRDVTVPDGVTSIEASAFENKGLTSVTLPNSLIQIEDRAFYNNMFTSITVPSLSVLIGTDSFDGDVLVTPSSFVVQLGGTTAANGGNNSGEDVCESVALDDSGNIYCAGYTDGALGEAYGGGLSDTFFMKLNSSGGLEWVTQLGGTTLGFTGGDNSGSDQCYSVAVDDLGNVYCAGYTTGALGEARGGGADVFVMKLNSSGAIQWVTQLGGTTTATGGNNSESDRCFSVAVDDSGNIYCAGYTTGALGEAYGGGLSDTFVMKLNSSGAIQWVTQLGDTTVASGGNNSGTDSCESVALDDSGNIYCAGSTTGAIGEANGGNYDAFVMKLNSSGDLQWVTQLGGTTLGFAGGDNSGNDSCNSVKLDASGNVYCAGSTGGALGEASGGDNDAFVMKLNSSGVLQWVTQLGDTTLGFTGGDNSGNDSCNSVELDASGNVYCAGYTSGALGEASGGDNDAFVMKLNSSGDLQWVKQLGGTTTANGGNNSGDDRCYSVALDDSGNIYCAGYTDGALGETNGGGGNADAFIMKLTSDGELF